MYWYILTYLELNSLSNREVSDIRRDLQLRPSFFWNVARRYVGSWLPASFREMPSIFGPFSQFCEKWLSALSCLPIRVEQLGFHRTYFHQIWYLSITRESVEKVQIWLKSDKNNKYFTWIPLYMYENVSLNLLRMRNVSDESCKENQNIFYVQLPLFPKVVPFKRSCVKIW